MKLIAIISATIGILLVVAWLTGLGAYSDGYSPALFLALVLLGCAGVATVGIPGGGGA